MNDSLFYSGKFKKGTIVYDLPIRFWEDEYKITKCTVLEDVKEYDKVIYVFSELYGHNVYIDRTSLFFSLEQAEKARKLYTELKEVCYKDEFELFWSSYWPKVQERLDNKKVNE